MAEQDERVRVLFEKEAQDYQDAYRKGLGARSVPFSRREKVVKEMFVWRDLRVLDVGSGPGIFTDWLLDRGCEVWTLDIAGEMVRLAQQAVAGHGREENGFFVIGSVLDLPFPDHFFDAVLCVGLVEYIEDLDYALGELARCIKPAGRIIITGPNGRSLINKIDNSAAALANFLFRPLISAKRGKGYLEFPYFHRRFDPDQFARLMETHGFKLKNRRFTNFRSRVLRGPLQGIADRMSLRLERSLAGTRLETMGTNLIASFERQ